MWVTRVKELPKEEKLTMSWRLAPKVLKLLGRTTLDTTLLIRRRATWHLLLILSIVLNLLPIDKTKMLLQDHQATLSQARKPSRRNKPCSQATIQSPAAQPWKPTTKLGHQTKQLLLIWPWGIFQQTLMLLESNRWQVWNMLFQPVLIKIIWRVLVLEPVRSESDSIQMRLWTRLSSTSPSKE